MPAVNTRPCPQCEKPGRAVPYWCEDCGALPKMAGLVKDHGDVYLEAAATALERLVDDSYLATQVHILSVELLAEPTGAANASVSGTQDTPVSPFVYMTLSSEGERLLAGSDLSEPGSANEALAWWADETVARNRGEVPDPDGMDKPAWIRSAVAVLRARNVNLDTAPAGPLELSVAATFARRSLGADPTTAQVVAAVDAMEVCPSCDTVGADVPWWCANCGLLPEGDALLATADRYIPVVASARAPARRLDDEVIQALLGTIVKAAGSRLVRAPFDANDRAPSRLLYELRSRQWQAAGLAIVDAVRGSKPRLAPGAVRLLSQHMIGERLGPQPLVPHESELRSFDTPADVVDEIVLGLRVAGVEPDVIPIHAEMGGAVSRGLLSRKLSDWIGKPLGELRAAAFGAER